MASTAEGPIPLRRSARAASKAPADLSREASLASNLHSLTHFSQPAPGPGCCAAAPAAAPPAAAAAGPASPGVHLALDVCWTSAETGIRSSKRLPLAAISGVGDLRGLFRSLIHGAFPAALPDYLTSSDFYKFAPAEEFASFPGDSSDTAFRLVAEHRGWAVTVAERRLGGVPDPERRLLVTVAEFESEPMELGDGTEVIVTLVTYPTVSVDRGLLDEAVASLVAAAAAAGGPPVGFGADAAGPAAAGDSSYGSARMVAAAAGPLEDDASSAAMPVGAEL